MTSEVVLVMESSCLGPHLTSRVTCRIVTMIMWRYLLDVEDAQLENTAVNIILQACLLMCTPLTTACRLSSTLTALVLARGLKPIIHHLLLVIKLECYFFNMHVITTFVNELSWT